MPGLHHASLALAAAHGQLGETQPARVAVGELLLLRPDYASAAREELCRIWSPELVEHMIDGLRKAGLDIAPA